MGIAGCVRVRACAHQRSAISTQSKLNAILHLCNCPDFKTSSHFSSPHVLAPLFHHDHTQTEETWGQEKAGEKNEWEMRAKGKK